MGFGKMGLRKEDFPAQQSCMHVTSICKPKGSGSGNQSCAWESIFSSKLLQLYKIFPSVLPNILQKNLIYYYE